MQKNKQFAVGVTMFVTGISAMVVASIVERRAEKKRHEAFQQHAREMHAYNEMLTNVSDELDAKLEAAKFWDIATRD